MASLLVEIPIAFLSQFGWEKLSRGTWRVRLERRLRRALRDAVRSIQDPAKVAATENLIRDASDQGAWLAALAEPYDWSGGSIRSHPRTRLAEAFLASMRQLEPATFSEYQIQTVAEHFGRVAWDDIQDLVRRAGLPVRSMLPSDHLGHEASAQPSFWAATPASPDSALWSDDARKAIVGYVQRLIDDLDAQWAPHLAAGDPAREVWIPPTLQASVPDPDSAYSARREELLDWGQAVSLLCQDGQFTILEGPPGAGKTSTAMRLIQHVGSIQCEAEQTDRGSRRVLDALPIYISSSDSIAPEGVRSAAAFCEDLEEVVRAKYPTLLRVPEVRELFFSYIRCGRVLLVVDTPGDANIASRTETSLARYRESFGRRAAAILCRRPLATEVGSTTIAATIIGFSPASIVRYLNATGLDAVRMQRALDILATLRRQLSLVLPLHVSMAYLVARHNVEMRQVTRSDLYLASVHFLSGQSWNSVHIPADAPDSDLSIASAIAIKAASDPDGWRETLTLRDLATTRTGGSLFSSALFFQVAPEPNPRFRFVHRSFQEFLVALSLANSPLPEPAQLDASPWKWALWDLDWTLVLEFASDLVGRNAMMKWLSRPQLENLCPIHVTLWRRLVVCASAVDPEVIRETVDAILRHASHFTLLDRAELAISLITLDEDTRTNLTSALLKESTGPSRSQVLSSIALALPMTEEGLVEQFDVLEETQTQFALSALAWGGPATQEGLALLRRVAFSSSRSLPARASALAGFLASGTLEDLVSIVGIALSTSDEMSPLRALAREVCTHWEGADLAMALKTLGAPPEQVKDLRPSPDDLFWNFDEDGIAALNRLRVVEGQASRVQLRINALSTWRDGEPLTARNLFIRAVLAEEGVLSRLEATERLRKIQESVQLLAAFRDDKFGDERHARSVLYGSAEERELDSPADRLAAATLLASTGDGLAKSYLITRVLASALDRESSPDTEILALARDCGDARLAALLEALLRKDPATTASIARNLIGGRRFTFEECSWGQESVDGVAERLVSKIPPWRAVAISAARRCDGDGAWLTEAARSQDVSQSVRFDAITTLGMLSPSIAYKPLAEVYEHTGDPLLRQAALVAALLVATRRAPQKRFQTVLELLGAKSSALSTFAQLTWPLLLRDSLASSVPNLLAVASQIHETWVTLNADQGEDP